MLLSIHMKRLPYPDFIFLQFLAFYTFELGKEIDIPTVFIPAPLVKLLLTSNTLCMLKKVFIGAGNDIKRGLI